MKSLFKRTLSLITIGLLSDWSICTEKGGA